MARTGTAGREWRPAIVVAGAVAAGFAASPRAPPPRPAAAGEPGGPRRSVITAKPGPLNGTVDVDNELGLPALPNAPQAANGTSTARVLVERRRQGPRALPSSDGERTLVNDGTTRWSYDSTDRPPRRRRPARRPRVTTDAPDGIDPQTDPAGAATAMIADLRKTSTVAVEGTAEVAGRSAYPLVLTPPPTERTLLREVRVSVDAEKRLPLQLSVLATGSPQPALTIGFTDITFGPQDQSLFTFTPPPGTTVRTPRRAARATAVPPPAPRRRAPSATGGTGSSSPSDPRRPRTRRSSRVSPTSTPSARRSAVPGARVG